MKELIIPSLLFGCSVFAPAFLSAFTSRDNDKGRLSEQAGRRSELRPTRYLGLFLKAKSRGEPLCFFLGSQKERKKADSRYKRNFPPEAEGK